MLDQAGRCEQQHVGEALRERLAVGRDALVTKQEPLHDTQAQRFGPGQRVQHAGGHTRRELMRVGHTVDTGEGVVAVDRLEVEVLRGSVEIRQAALLAKRRVDVQHARLQRLAHRLPEPAGVALENPGAVEADTWDHARHPAAPGKPAAGQRRIECVRGCVERQARRDAPARSDKRQRQAAQRVKPQAGHALAVHGGQVVGVGEAIEFALETGFEAGPDAKRGARADLRHALVRRGHRRVQALQQLPFLHPRVGGPGPERAADPQVGRQQARRDAGHRAGKVLPVVVVRDAQRIQLQPRVADQVGVVNHVRRIAAAAGDAVVGQQVQAGAAAVARLQVAKLAVQPQAAPAAERGRQRRVPVRGQVPVVRHRDLQAALAVDVDAGWQPARLARIGERETEHRCGQDRHPQKAQHRAFGDAFIGVEIELHAVGGEQPRRSAAAVDVVGSAARISGTRGNGTLFAQKVEPLGHAARAHLPEVIGGVDEEAFEALHLQLQFRAAEHVAVAGDAHIATGLRQVIGGFVAEPVGANHHAATAQFGVAFGHGFQVGPTAQFARQQDGRQLLGRLATRRWLQRRRCLQQQPGGGRTGCLRSRVGGRPQRQRSRHRQQPQARVRETLRSSCGQRGGVASQDRTR